MGDFFLNTGATFGGEGKQYRYSLWRIWNRMNDPLICIGMNPSTADAGKDDPTIALLRRRAAAVSRFGGLLMLNLHAYRSTDMKKLAKVDDPIGPLNLQTIEQSIQRGAIVLAAWGAGPIYGEMDQLVLCHIRNVKAKVFHLGLTKDGQPRHPLYISLNTPLTEWKPE